MEKTIGILGGMGHPHPAYAVRGPQGFDLRGASELPRRQGFACGKTLGEERVNACGALCFQ